MNERERFKKIVEHWLKHNLEHAVMYLEWAKKLEEEEKNISELLHEVHERSQEIGKLLEKTLKLL